MNELDLSLAIGLYDRTFPLFDGRIRIEGCHLRPIALEPSEIFHRAFKFAEFDICELSLSSHTVMTSTGRSEYVGIPAFTSRAFRHSGIYIRTDRGIKRPEDLKGKTIGMPEYQQTAQVFVRGFLQDEHDVNITDVKWRTGGDQQTQRGERTSINVGSHIDLKPIPPDRTLSQMLVDGELDAVLAARIPLAYARKAPNIDRLFPDYIAAEQSYFERTQIFPIMHLVGIRRSLVEQHPWLPVSVYKAFVKAKEIAIDELAVMGHLAVTLPWPCAEQSRARKIMGEDYWSYGAEANQHVLETFLRYSHEQGLIPKPLAWTSLFAPSTLDLAKV